MTKFYILLNLYSIKNIKDADYIAIYKLIPNIIHKIFIDDTMEKIIIPQNISNAINSWTNLNPGYTLKYWFGNDCLKYLKNHV